MIYLKKSDLNIAIFSLGISFSYVSLAAESFDPAIDGLLRNQQRQDQLEKIIQPDPNVQLDSVQQKSKLTLTKFKDQPCFDIQKITLTGNHSEKFSPYLDKALRELNFEEGMCLGETAVTLIISHTQNLLIDRGYTTTRILVEPQNLALGQLNLIIIPGLVRQIKLDWDQSEVTHVERIQYANNIFPLKNGDILNLRALEQGLENLKRVPTAEADIQIVPADVPNQSDVIVKWKQRKIPVRLTLSADDAGSKQTGKYQGNVTFSLDNPLFRSDLFYFTVGQELADKKVITDQNGLTVKSGTLNYAMHYSIPLKNWLVSANASRYQYDQAVAGTNNVYNYNGESSTQDISLSRLLHRDATSKTTVTAKAWRRASKSYIDDAELTVQRRTVAGWQFNIDHREYIQSAVLDLSLGYKRGTGALNALRAPEELFDEGTSRIKIWTFDANINTPFKISDHQFSYSSALHAQYNDTPLTTQDRLSIGGRYTVRGFDGNTTLLAERGAYWRNDLAWSYLPAHQFYMALDAGHVDGQSAEWLLGKTLAGSAIGIRGQFKIGGRLYYDIFAAMPIYKPDDYRTDKTNYGFSLNYSF